MRCTPEQLAKAIDEMAENPKGGKMAAIAYKHSARLVREKLGDDDTVAVLLDALHRVELWLTTVPDSSRIAKVCRDAIKAAEASA